jgi:hypothetical protein
MLSITSLAQKTIIPNQLSDQIEKHNQHFPIEKLYLSFDKPYYSVGDTLWFKSFLLNANHQLNKLSDRLYVELFNDSSQLIERRVVALNNGLGYGDFSLNKDLKDGSYTIRAYTNWQQNFGSTYFFQKNFYIGNAGDKTWLLTASQKIVAEGKNKNMELDGNLTNLRNEAAGYRDIEITLLKDQKKVLRTDLKTTLNGSFNIKIPLPSETLTGNFSFLITDKKDKDKKAILPLFLNGDEEIDLQFMPEGGYLINGMYSKVAFKAIGIDGLGKNISGKIVNSQNEEVAQFRSNHNGMGNFSLLPTTAETYYATYTLSGKEQKTKLPNPKTEGTVLRIDHLSKSDSILIFVKASLSKRLDQDYELMAQTGDSLVFGVKINLKNGFSNLKLPKNLFPDGIIHFTLFSPENQPINERNAFINLKGKINLKIEPSKNAFKPRDSIALEITATNESGLPLSGAFSIAVTDGNQVVQSVQNNILSYYFLESNLKGNIEDAAWYLKDNDQQTLIALDNLLLTQGWVGYNWAEILANNEVAPFIIERDNKITGRLTNLFKKPVPDLNVTLLSMGKDMFVSDTTSNERGEFIFKNLPLKDTTAFTIKVKNIKGKAATATIAVNEFEPPAPVNLIQKLTPWYVNSDSTRLKHFIDGNAKVKQADKAKMILSGIGLKEVEIKANKPSIAYEVAWDAKPYKTISEEELKKIPRKTLLSLLYETFPGFNIGRHWYISCASRLFPFPFDEYRIGMNLISSIKIDNISTIAAGSSAVEVFNTNSLVFNTLSAQDIKEIKMYKGCVFYYLHITTRSGKGPWVQNTPGVYVYRPMPINIGKEFYSPKYNIENDIVTKDYRSTIFWDANVVTDENGKAKLSFYAADKPSTYTIKIEGTDLLGRFGFKKSTLTIENKTESK